MRSQSWQSRHVRSGQAGFTLVELLVVIGIIAVLISILLPSLAKARQAALKVACAANMRSVGQMFVMYEADNKGKLPLGRNWTDGNWGGYPWGGCWAQAISPSGYGTSASTPDWSKDDSDKSVRAAKTFVCPAQAQDPDIQRTYIVMGRAHWSSSDWGGNPSNNNMVWGYGMGNAAPPGKVVTAPSVQRGKLRSAETIMMGEMRVSGSELMSWSDQLVRYHMGGEYGTADLGDLVDTMKGVWAHDLEGANYLFCDGHVEYQACPVRYSATAGSWDVLVNGVINFSWPDHLAGPFAMQFARDKSVYDPGTWNMSLP